MKIATLQEFKDYTKDLPGNTELQIECIYEYEEPAKTAPIFDVKIFGKNSNAPHIRIVPERLLLSNGERTLEASHVLKRGTK